MKKLCFAVSLALVSISAHADNRGFITLEGEYENKHNTSNDVNGLNIIPGVKLGDYTIDLKTQVQSTDNTRSNAANIEPRIKYSQKIGMTDFTVWVV
jgi:hypothetical protein